MLASAGEDLVGDAFHLAFDHHGDPLNYRISKAKAANEPSTTVWDATLFGPVVDSLVHGSRVTGVTYPRFVMAHEGTPLHVVDFTIGETHIRKP